MASTMSPTAPNKETAGLLAAQRFYGGRPNLSRAQIMESANLMEHGPYAAKQGGDWMRGFVTGAMAIAQQRS